MSEYDLIVIGSGPGGEKAAVKARFFGYSVALIEKEPKLGGAGSQTGTMPSKTLKETAIYLSGIRDKGVFGVERKLERKADIEEFYYRKNRVIEESDEEVNTNMESHGVDLYYGTASFLDAHRIHVEGEDPTTLTGRFILLATGSYPNHPPGIPFDGKHVHDSDTILQLDRIPQSLVVIGAGVIGCEYASIFALMNQQVTLINSRESFLQFIDPEITAELRRAMESNGVHFLMGNSVEKVQIDENPPRMEDSVKARLSNGQEIGAEMFLYAAGRNGCIHQLELDKVGIDTGPRETIAVNEQYQTNLPNVYAVGDVIGFPALASTSMDQGRVAVAHMFQLNDLVHIQKQFSFGIYTIPEVASIGKSEADCQKEGIACITGRAYVSKMPRGRIMGFTKGILKIICERETQKVIGVHVVAAIATEIIHFGMVAVEDEMKLTRLIGMVYNMPTLHELYKYAAYDALTKVEKDAELKR